MNILRQLDDAIAYIEENLWNEIDQEEIARRACVTADSFLRFFSYMCGMTLNEYIRRRRLTLAAYEIRNSKTSVIDVAVKYGYNSADAFAKAFTKQHGITPTQACDPGRPLKIYPPVSFHIIIKGAKEMNFRIVETEQIKLCGLWKDLTGTAANRFGQEGSMWEEYDDYQERISQERFGTWYGIWDGGRYWIAKPKDKADETETETCDIPAGKYAAFSTECGGYAGDELPGLREMIFESWLSGSGYVQTHDYEIEIYHLFPKSRKKERYYEIWIPVEEQR